MTSTAAFSNVTYSVAIFPLPAVAGECGRDSCKLFVGVAWQQQYCNPVPVSQSGGGECGHDFATLYKSVVQCQSVAYQSERTYYCI
jgi:hypothetical protein